MAGKAWRVTRGRHRSDDRGQHRLLGKGRQDDRLACVEQCADQRVGPSGHRTERRHGDMHQQTVRPSQPQGTEDGNQIAVGELFRSHDLRFRRCKRASGPLPACRALLQKGAHALLPILGGKQEMECLTLVGHALRQEALLCMPDHVLPEPDGQRSASGEFTPQFDGRIQKGLHRVHLVDQSPRQRFRRRQRAVVEHDLHRQGFAHDAGEFSGSLRRQG